ncbi:hypothetical protein PanWU01x14_055690 [Parasponia andersonii]|uniref:Uncharacterized protein n=1 Tax=Parasponia andersonii TaxID=3476 RepID=A0A2P5DK51_PARAD|nr:hypothetical protein PanWU01x14_055690 [Parasponia andersonii]
MGATITNFCLKEMRTRERERQRDRESFVQSSCRRTADLTPKRTDPRFSPVANEVNAGGLASIGAQTTELEADDTHWLNFLAKPFDLLSARCRCVSTTLELAD